MNNCTVFVSSADSYSDLWDVFFDLFQKYWPEYKGEIVLNTQEKDYHHEGLNIRCTKVGKLKGFGATYKAGLSTITTDNVLVFLIDFIFMSKVDSDRIEDYYNYFVKEKLDNLCLNKQPFNNCSQTSREEFLIPNEPYPNSVLFSYLAGFWKKKILSDIILSHEDPWMSEWYGSKRAVKMKIREEYLSDNKFNPINYDTRGCIHRGLWLSNAIDFLKTTYDKKIDFSKRGYYDDNPIYSTLKYRLYVKYALWSTGVKGSYWDLIKRKSIH